MSTLTRIQQVAARFPVFDRVIFAALLAIATLAVFDPGQVPASLTFAGHGLIEIAPFIAMSVAFAAFARASNFDHQIARAFASTNTATAVTLAALLGTLSPFCSCGVVPIIAGLLAARVPLAPIMAFWLTSPQMDPEMLILMLPVFGAAFTGAKVASAILVGLTAGLATHALTRVGFLSEILTGTIASTCCDARGATGRTAVDWTFWRNPDRRDTFLSSMTAMSAFLGKWLALAFFLESVMLAYVPASTIAQFVGGDQAMAIPLAVAAGMPAYMNGYAAIPLVSGLMELGMSNGAALSLMLAGGVTSLPAAVAVWSLVRPIIFALYLACGWIGAMGAGYVLEFIW